MFPFGNQRTRRQVYRLLLIAGVLTAIGAGAIVVASDTAQADVTVDGLDVADTTRTIDSNVTDVTLAADLAFDHDVSNADQRVITLKAAPEGGTTEMLTYRVGSDVTDTDSGTVTLSNSLFDHPDISADAVNPAPGETTTTTIEVIAELEVTRANGDVVTRTATDTATLTVTATGEVTLSIGGDASLTVQTEQ